MTETMDKRAKRVMEHLGLPSFSALVHAGITEKYDKLFPAYMEQKFGSSESSEEEPKSAYEKAKQKKKIKEQLALEPFRDLCSRLQGEVIEDGTGALICRYPYFNQLEKEMRDVPLMSVSPGMLTYQYFPDKETIEEWRKMKLLKYD